MEKNDATNQEKFISFIETTVLENAVWLLKAHDGLYAMVEDNNDQTYLPVWPLEQMAKEFVTAEWEGYIPDKMSLKEFLEWMHELKDDNILIGVSPGLDMHLLALDPLELRKQIIQLKYDKPEDKA